MKDKERFPRIIDGGTGTELERLGVPMNGVAWSAEAVASHPETLLQVHQSFLKAGAQLLIANTFAASLHNLEPAGLAAEYERINRDAVCILKKAVASEKKEAWIAGALSTTTFTGALDTSRLPRGDAAVSRYAKQAEIQAEAGAELIILEMMRDIDHTALALEGALRAGRPVWVGFSCAAAKDGVFLLDTDIPLRRALAEIPLQTAQAVGIMHTLIEHTPAALDVLQPAWSGKTFAYPHAGRFRMPHWIFQDVISPEAFALEGKALLDRGVDAVGGCCGISPAHIRAFHDLLVDGACNLTGGD